MFEHRTQPVLARKLYYLRLARGFLRGLGILVAALGVGMVGYRATEHMAWIDAFANASMILSGMGPLEALKTDGGKLFAGCYALFSGLAFMAILGVVFAPVVHRFLHLFHSAQGATDPKGEKK